MTTSITRILTLLVSLAALFGFVRSAGAQAVTFNPAAVTLALEGSLDYSVTYRTTISGGACSSEGEFYTTSDPRSTNRLGVIPRSLLIPGPANAANAVESVTVPAAVVDHVRRQRITGPIWYIRTWVDCRGGGPAVFTPLPITFTSSSVSAAPAAARVAAGADTLVAVLWRVLPGGGGSTRVESREGRFVDGRGNAHGPVVRDLLQGSGGGSAEVSETLRVPGSVVQTIRDAGGLSGMRFERTFVVNGAPAVGTLTLQPANAIQSVDPRPARIAVKPQSAMSVDVRWDIALLPGVTGPAGSPLSITSSEGVFRSPEGRVLGRVGTSLSEPVPAPAAAALSARALGGGLVVSEQLSIPHAVIDAALETGFTSFSFQRVFRIGADRAAGELHLDFAGRIAATFGIDRVELRFLDGTRYKSVPIGEEVQVAADVTFRGSGRLQGSWDLAGPTTTPGAAVFVRGQLVDEYLSFGRRTVIRSMGIKAGQPGVYTVRLSLTAPPLGAQDSLQLSFFVRATGGSLEISLGQPPPLARLSPGLPFAWEAVAGARNYILEFYEAPTAEGGEPAAGMVLAGGDSRATLSKVAERSLEPGRSYWWRVVALGPEGVLLGQSPLRELLAPRE